MEKSVTKSVNAAPVKKRKKSQTAEVMKRLFARKPALIGFIVLMIVILLAIIAPLIAPYSAMDMDYSAFFAGPSKEHLLGCDNLGRDIFSRLLYGAKYSLGIGFSVALIGMFCGLFFGTMVGYAGGTVDNVVMRICDIWSALPGNLLAILLSTILGGGMFATILALTIGGIPASIRSTRAMALREREMDYLEAAEAMNCSKMKIMYKHMLPNIVAPAIIGTTGQIGNSIMSAASLSFIGLGVQPPTPEWGAMLSAGRAYILQYPNLLIWPGIAIGITVLSINLLGDGLRDAMDPKLKD